MKRGTVWLIGLLGIVVLWGAAVAMKARPIERHVAVTTVTELKRRGLDRHFEALSIQVDGRDLTLIGTALTEADRAAALAVAAATPGVERVIDRITVAPELKPFVFRVVRNADGSATLSGGAPAPEQLDRLIELARALFGRDLHISLRVARGAPAGDWFAAAKLAVETVALIERGEAVLSDRRLTLAGRAPGDGVLDAVETALARSMPAGYQGRSELVTRLDEELIGAPLESEKSCQALVDKVTARPAIRFAAGRAALENPPPRLFERLALAVRRCPGLFILIYASSDTRGGDPAANLRLAEARAETLAEELAKRGIVRARMTALGRARPDPRQRPAAADVEFRVSDSAVPVVRPYVWQFEKRAGGNGVLSGHHPSREAAGTLAGIARPAVRGELDDATRLAHGAPPGDWLAAARLAIEAVATLDRGVATLTDYELALSGVAKDDETLRAVEALLAERMPKDFRAKTAFTTALDQALNGGELADAAGCQALIDSVTRTANPEFVFDGPALFHHQQRLFERLAAAARRCSGFTLEIGAHSSGIGDPDAARALSERWAEAVADALTRGGAERRRLRTVGFGNTRPLGGGETEAGRLRNRRIVFRIVS
jgi:OmpA-OmpF porin, OOP family